MKKLIILLTLVAVSFSADKWEYLIGVHLNGSVVKSKQVDDWMILPHMDLQPWVGLTEEEVLKSKYNVMDSGKPNPHYLGMNLLGEDGWELMFKEQGENNFELYYFKRKIN